MAGAQAAGTVCAQEAIANFRDRDVKVVTRL